MVCCPASIGGDSRSLQEAAAATVGVSAVFTAENLARAEALAEFAESKGHTLLELALSWLASRPAVASVIAGAKTPEQVRANAAAAAWNLTEQDLAEIARILE